VLIRALAGQGIEVVEAQIPNETRFWQRPPKMLRQGFLRTRAQPVDALILAELNQTNIPYAKLVAVTKRIPLIFDPFFSLYDSLVLTRKTVRPGGLRARSLWWRDWISLNWSDVLIADTSAHREYYREEFGVRKPIVVAPIGADTSRFHPLPFLPHSDGSPFRVLFWGTFIPLQGVEFIVEAARICQESKADVEFDLIGAGSTLPEMQQLAQRCQLDNLRFLGRQSQEFIVAQARRSHVCLGIFGNTNKTRRVVPNKLFEALALGKPVISARTPATDERLEAGVDYQECGVADGASLAHAILLLKRNPDKLRRIAERGLMSFRANFCEMVIGARLVSALRELPL